MQLFLDVDGVILDFEKAFMEYIRSTYHPELPPGYRPKTWEMHGEFGDVDIEVAWEDFTSSEAFQQLELIADAKSFNALSAQFEVWLVTNLPDKLRASRLANLRAHGLKFKGLLLGGHHNFSILGYPTKSQVIRLLRHKNEELVFLDDHPVNCQDVAQHYPGAKVFLMTRPHNEKGEFPFRRVANWEEFYAALQA